MKKIDFESHFAIQEWVEAMFRNETYPKYIRDQQTKTCKIQWSPNDIEPIGDILLKNLLDIGEGRLRKMDEDGIDVEVLSLTIPGVDLMEPNVASLLAKKINNTVSDVVKRYPNRFIGFATLSPQNPQEAAEELERAVIELKLKGWKTHSNYGENYIDDRRYWPILEKAEKLGIPIYLHPSYPSIPQLKTSYGWALSGAPFGFGVETAICMMRLILSGAFDRFPNLKIILGHLGEGLPFLFARMDYPYVIPWFDPNARPRLTKKPSDYFKSNVFVTTSGNYFKPAFMCTYEAMGIDRILLGTDYPYEDPKVCLKFIESLGLSMNDKEKIYFRNAAQLGIEI